MSAVHQHESQNCPVILRSGTDGADRGLTDGCAEILDGNCPTVVDEVSLTITRFRCEYLHVGRGFNVEATSKHFFAAWALHMDVSESPGRQKLLMSHDLVAGDTV